MIRRYQTRNSVYEVDYTEMRARRLNGKNDPTEYTGEDGQWQDIIAAGVKEDLPQAGLLIIWAKPGNTGGFATTYTSEVLETEEVEDN